MPEPESPLSVRLKVLKQSEGSAPGFEKQVRCAVSAVLHVALPRHSVNWSQHDFARHARHPGPLPSVDAEHIMSLEPPLSEPPVALWPPVPLPPPPPPPSGVVLPPLSDEQAAAIKATSAEAQIRWIVECILSEAVRMYRSF